MWGRYVVSYFPGGLLALSMLRGVVLRAFMGYFRVKQDEMAECILLLSGICLFAGRYHRGVFQ